MLKWIAQRLDGTAEARETPIGYVPTPSALDTEGLNLSDEALELLTSVDLDVWSEEASLIPAYYNRFGDRLPKALWDQHTALGQRLEAARAAIAAE